MRRAFGKTIVKLAEKDPNIFLISGDVEQEMDENTIYYLLKERRLAFFIEKLNYKSKKLTDVSILPAFDTPLFWTTLDAAICEFIIASS